MYRCIILVKVVRHGLDLFLDACKISTFLSNYEALSCMFLACGKLRIFSVSYCLKCSFYRNGVLLCILDSGNPADGVRMSLAHTFAPKSIVFSFRQNGICIAFFILYFKFGMLLHVIASMIISGGSPPDLTNSGSIAFIYSRSRAISELVSILTSWSVRVKYSGRAVNTL